MKMHRFAKQFPKVAALLLALLMLTVFAACTNGNELETVDTTPVTDAATDAAATEPVTAAPDTDEPATDAPETMAPETAAPETDAPATEAPETEPASEPVTEPVTEAEETLPETEAVTEAEETLPETEPVTEEVLVIPEEAPDENNKVTFFDTPKNEELLDGKLFSAAIESDEDGAPILKLTTAGEGNFRDPYAKLDYAAYMDMLDLEPMNWNDCGFAVVTLKVEGVTNNKLELQISGTDGSGTAKARGEATYSKNGNWQTVQVPLVTASREGFTLESIRIDFVDKAAGAGETVYIRSIAFTSDKMELLELMGKELIKPSYATVTIPGLTEEFTFLQITDTHVSAFSDEDAKAWTANRVTYNTARRNAFMADGLYSEERFFPLFEYGDEIGADGLFLTGDLIDFPSEKSISMLYDAVKSTQAKSIFCLGNHDWTFADDYMSANAVATYIPRFAELTGGDPYISIVEYDQFLVVAVDNSTDVITQATVDKFLALYEKNKPIILLLHVPLHADTLAPDVKKAWGGRNITMGPGAMGSDWGSVQQFYNAVCVAEDTPVVAVFAGHVHFNHEDTFPNGVPQYITSTGYTGDCRVITVKGE